MRVDLGVQLDPAWQDDPVTFTVMSEAGRIWAGFPSDGCTIPLQLPHDPLTEGAPVRLVIRCEPANGTQARRAPTPRFTLGWITAWPEYGKAPAPHLPIGGRLDLTQLVRADPAGLGWSIDEAGTARMAAPEARCYVTVIAAEEPLELALLPAAPLPQGWLRIVCGGVEIFAGQPMPGAELRCRVPASIEAGPNRLELLFSFTPHDPTDPCRPGFTEIGLAVVRRSPIARSFREVGPATHARLNLGQRISFDTPATAALHLLQGWDAPDELGVRNTAAEASLGFQRRCQGGRPAAAHRAGAEPSSRGRTPSPGGDFRAGRAAADGRAGRAGHAASAAADVGVGAEWRRGPDVSFRLL